MHSTTHSIPAGPAATATLLLILSVSGVAEAQQMRNTGHATLRPPSNLETFETRVHRLEDTLRLQDEKIERLQKTVEEQAVMIRSLLSSRTESLKPATSVADSGPTPPTTQPLQQQAKAPDEKAAPQFPIRLSGDMRLRLDAILRPSTKLTDPPLPRQQNVRMRYRLRLNVDTDINSKLSFHGQLSTGPFNNPLTQDQDFTSTVARHPLSISEAWIDYHPTKSIQLQGGRVQEVFADNSRFLFDDDIRFNGFNQKVGFSLGRDTTLEIRAGQYWFSNPNVAVIVPGSPLDRAESGSRSAMLFHQGVLMNHRHGERWSQQFGGDVQLFREPNQIQLASTVDGVILLVQPGLGIALSGPISGTGNATTTPGGVVYTANDFHVARLTYRLSHSGFESGSRRYPFTLNLQVARNFGAGARERDAMLAAFQVGKVADKGDMSFLYIFSIKGANSLISQVTDDDVGTGSGVNIRSHHLRWDVGLAKKVTLQSLLFTQRQIRSSGQFPNFFVPVGSFAPRQYRFQEQVTFSF